MTVLWLVAAQAGSFPYEVQSTVLDNGMEIVTIPMSTPGVVASQLHMDVGARQEIDAGRTGFAHFFEHLMFSDTAERTRVEREDRLLELGIRDGAYTTTDRTVYHAMVPSPSLDPWLEVLASSFTGLALTPEAVRKESGAVYGEWRKTAADPDLLMEEAVLTTAFTVHPYGHTVLGFEADIAAMPDAHAYAQIFASRWYRPERARLVLAGDVDPTAALALAKKHFGGWTPPPLEEVPELPVEPEQVEPRRRELTWPQPTSPRLIVAWKVPATRETRDTAALNAVEALLFGSRGRLQNRLVREEKLATMAFGGHDENVDPGLFSMYVRANRSEDLERIEAIVEEELQRLRDEPPADVLEAAKGNAKYRVLTSLDEPDAVASTVARRLAQGATVDDLGARETAFDAVDTAEVQRVTSTFLIPDRRTTIVLRGTP